MSAAKAASRVAIRHISLFSIALWGVGLGFVIVVGVISFSGDDGAFPNNAAYEDEPWLNPNPTLATNDGDVWSGDNGDVIRLTDLDTTKALHISVIGDGYPRATVTGENGALLFLDQYDDAPSFTISEYAQEYVLPPAESLELWIDSDEPWQIEAKQVELDELSGTVSGVGSAAFIYTGTATSARVSVRGEYSLRLNVIAGLSAEDVLSASGNVDRTVAWPDNDGAIFVISTYDETAWTIEMPDEPASTQTPEPSTPSGEGEAP